MPSSCRILNTLLPAFLGAMLLAGELVIAVLAFGFPHEPQLYKEFYIAHTRDCWLPPDAQQAALQTLSQPQIEVSALDPNAACYLLARGWNSTPPWGETTQLKPAWLDLPPPPPGAKTLAITFATIAPQGPQIIQIGIPGQPAARLTLPAGQVPVSVTLPLPAPAGSSVKLHLERSTESTGGIAVLRLKWNF